MKQSSQVKLWVGGTICALIFGRAAFYVAAKFYFGDPWEAGEWVVIAIGAATAYLTWSYAKKLFGRHLNSGDS